VKRRYKGCPETVQVNQKIGWRVRTGGSRVGGHGWSEIRRSRALETHAVPFERSATREQRPADHHPLEQRVDEGHERGLLAGDDEATEHDEHDHERQQPELLAYPHEIPEIAEEVEHAASPSGRRRREPGCRP
jgi:hypothetical protein